MGLKLTKETAAGNDMLHHLLIQRSALESRKRNLDQELSDWKEEALPIMMAHEMKSFKDDNVGSMTVVDGTSKSINRDLLIANLLEIGLEADTVADVVEKSTKTSKYTTIQFKAKNGG